MTVADKNIQEYVGPRASKIEFNSFQNIRFGSLGGGGREEGGRGEIGGRGETGGVGERGGICNKKVYRGK